MNKATLMKVDDSWQIKVNLSIKSASEISFYDNMEPIEILSASDGFIQDDILIMSKGVRYLEVVLDHVHNIRNIECIINGRHNGEQEVVMLSVPSVDSMSHTVPEIKTVKSIESPDGVKIFYKPEWRVNLSVVGDLRVAVVDSGVDIFAAVGDASKISSASDFVFPVNKYCNHIIVPKEIIWMMYKEYNGHKLGCYELVKLAHRPNILYKVPISNNLDFADLPQKIPVQLRFFRCPTGTSFDPSHWFINENSNLPVYTR